MLERDAKTRRSAVIKNIDRERLQSDDFGEAIYDSCNVVECVGERFARWHIGLTETDEVRRNDMEAVCKQWNEIAEHVAGGWEAVQQQERLRIPGPGLSVEDLHAIDICSLVLHLCHVFSPHNYKFHSLVVTSINADLITFSQQP